MWMCAHLTLLCPHYHIQTMTEHGQEESCRLCGDGGALLGCDSLHCPYAFCHNCIRRNFGTHALKNIRRKQKWLCYVCDSTPLKNLMDPKQVTLANVTAWQRLATVVLNCCGIVLRLRMLVYVL
jgi:hypothetical protein